MRLAKQSCAPLNSRVRLRALFFEHEHDKNDMINVQRFQQKLHPPDAHDKAMMNSTPKPCVLLRLLIGLFFSLLTSSAFAQTSRPNILLVVADDLGWSDVGWHDGFAKTPSLDRLVREGVELDQHYVQPFARRLARR